MLKGIQIDQSRETITFSLNGYELSLKTCLLPVTWWLSGNMWLATQGATRSSPFIAELRENQGRTQMVYYYPNGILRMIFKLQSESHIIHIMSRNILKLCSKCVPLQGPQSESVQQYVTKMDINTVTNF